MDTAISYLTGRRDAMKNYINELEEIISELNVKNDMIIKLIKSNRKLLIFIEEEIRRLS